MKVWGCKVYRWGIGSVVLIVLLGGFSFAAEEYPTKPVNMVVGFPAGGMMDIQVRALAPRLSKELGQPVIIVNKPGAGAVLAINYVANSKPDGYTIMNAGLVGNVTGPYMFEVHWHPEDFTYIMSHSSYNLAFLVKKDAPWKTFQEWIDYAKKNPGFKYGTWGVMTPLHVLMEWIGKELGLKLVHIPYAGGLTGLTALMGGHIEICTSAGTHIPLVKGGKLRTLLQVKGRIADPPGTKVQYINEIFKNPPIRAIDLPVGIFAPKGVPAPIVHKLSEALKKSTIDNPDFIKANEGINLDVEYISPAETVKAVKEGYIELGKLIKELNLIKEIKKEKVQ